MSNQEAKVESRMLLQDRFREALPSLIKNTHQTHIHHHHHQCFHFKSADQAYRLHYHHQMMTLQWLWEIGQFQSSGNGDPSSLLASGCSCNDLTMNVAAE